MRIASVPPDAIKIPKELGGIDTSPTGVQDAALTRIDLVFVGLDGMFAVYTFILSSKEELENQPLAHQNRLPDKYPVVSFDGVTTFILLSISTLTGHAWAFVQSPLDIIPENPMTSTVGLYSDGSDKFKTVYSVDTE